MIACLGWGSLIWDPRDLPLLGPWREDGPTIHVDFLRHSSRSRVTLVLDPSGPAVPSLWNQLRAPTWEEAARVLAIREGVEKMPWMISHWMPGAPEPPNVVGLAAWAASTGISHLVWTGLPPRWNGMDGNVPTKAQVVDFLRNLPLDKKPAAEDYVRRAPRQIVTPIRTALADELGWTSIS